LLLALLAAGGVYLLGSLGGGGGLGGATQTVVIAKNPIPMRHQITAADVDILKGVSTNVTNTYSNPNDLVGLIAEIQISKGGIITKDMLAKDIGLVPTGAGPAYLPIPKGWIAMTIPTGEQQGVAGNITKDDYITVIASASLSIFATGKSASGPPKVVSKTVFTNVRVIGLGPATSNVQPASGAATVGGTTPSNGGLTSSLTIELTQCDAEFFTWFLNNTQLKYTLESQQDYLSTPPTGPDTQNCPNGFDSAKGVSQTEVEARYHFTAL
jgi:Flp pilus assembly protein CpaB